MTDKITKLLAKLSKKDLSRIQNAVEKINKLELEGLNLKAVKGQTDIFRVRIGDYRIVFKISADRTTRILLIDRRSEKTYRDF
jgi:mRNA-degrading endonuclease RelE of RelBE toxin-antitoxin system